MEIEYDIVRHAGIKHQAAAPLLRLSTNGTDRTLLDGSVPILVLTCEKFAQRWKPLEQEEKESETNGQTIDVSTPFLPEVFALPDHVQESETYIPDLQNFIQHQGRDNECSQAAINVGKPNTIFSYNTDGVLVRESAIDNVSQTYVPTVLRARSLRLCHYSLLAGHPDERQLYDTMRRDFY